MKTSPLTSYAQRLSDAPYRALHEWRGKPPAYVFPVMPKTEFGIPRRGAYVHLVTGAAGMIFSDTLILGTRWQCGGGSNDAILLAEPADAIFCPTCSAVSEPTVYRLFDAAGRLLYVGCTEMPAVRMVQHSRIQPWWPDVARKQFEAYPTRTEALCAELKAILAEAPAHNGDPRIRTLAAVA